MSDENTETVSENTQSEATVNDSAPAQTSDRGGDDKPAGYYPVDPENATPEEVKNRIDYLYRQVKDQGRHLHDYRTVAQQQSQQIEELMNGVGQVVNHLHTKSVADTEAEVRQKMQKAFETGDVNGYLAEQERLSDLKVQKALAAQQKPVTQTRQQAFAGQPQSSSQIAKDAAADGEMSQQDATYVDAWQNEKDERGQTLRPWAKTQDPNDPDPDFVKAMIVAKKVWEKNPYRSAKENLAEVDKLMGVQNKGGGQSVLGGSLTTRAKNLKITLSPAQERIAVKTKFGAKQGAKSDSDYIAAYRKQIEKVQSSKGGR